MCVCLNVFRTGIVIFPQYQVVLSYTTQVHKTFLFIGWKEEGHATFILIYSYHNLTLIQRATFSFSRFYWFSIKGMWDENGFGILCIYV